MMKKLLFSVFALTLVTGAFAQKTPQSVAKLNSETIDLGKIKQGQPQPAKFIVTNISGEPLIIETASPTCGCTISDYTKSPIEPGKTGFISATYNAANLGHFEKTLTVKFAGIDQTLPIKITGDVIAADAQESNIVKSDDLPQNTVVVPVSNTATPTKAVTPKTIKSKSKTTKSKTKTKVTPAT